jgi:hypothetical protein
MIEKSKPSPGRQQWIVDPRSPMGFRLEDLPDSRTRPVAFFDGNKFERQFGTRRRPRRYEQPKRRHEIAFGEDGVVIDDGQIIILAGSDEWVIRDEGFHHEPFELGDVHNAYQWSMVLGDLHPCRPLGAVGAAEEGFGGLRRNTIELFARPRAIFKALLATYKSGKIKPVLAWDEEEPDDKTLLRFRREGVLTVISELGADGEVIRMLLAERERAAHLQYAAASDGARTNAAGVAALPLSTPRPRAPDSAVQAWYERHVKSHVVSGTPTSEEDDWAAAKEEFRDRVRQEQIRKLRRILVPAAWRKQGRRPNGIRPEVFRARMP